MVVKLKPEWQQREYLRKAARPGRIRAVGQGRPYFADFGTLALLMVLYVRTSCTNMLLACLFGIDEQTIYDLVPKLLPLLRDRFLPATALTEGRRPPGRINTVDDLIAAYPEIASVITDGMELPTPRPKRRQARNYSGKSKRHSKKTVLIVNSRDGLVLARTRLRPGAVHDKRILDEDPLHRRLDTHPELEKRADSAWTGEDALKGWIVIKRARRNHPLTEADKRENRKRSKVRIAVEHAIRRVKVFRRVADKVAFRLKERRDEVLNAAINLANFKQLIRHPVTA